MKCSFMIFKRILDIFDPIFWKPNISKEMWMTLVINPTLKKCHNALMEVTITETSTRWLILRYNADHTSDGPHMNLNWKIINRPDVQWDKKKKTETNKIKCPPVPLRHAGHFTLWSINSDRVQSRHLLHVIHLHPLPEQDWW